MPMLERTAVSLEQCNVHRALPKATRTLRTYRKLHTTVRQHGATDLVLSDAWQGSTRGSASGLGAFTANPLKAEALAASSPMLEFLYPRGAKYLMQRLVSARGRLEWRPWPRPLPRSPPPRPYTSMTDADEALAVDAWPNHGSHATASPTVGHNGSGGVVGGSEAQPRRADAHLVWRTGHTWDPLAQPSEIGHALSLVCKPDGSDGLYDRVWLLFSRLDDISKKEVHAKVLAYLGTSNRLGEAWRVSESFSTLDPHLWEPQAVAAAVKAELRLQNTTHAAAIFDRALALRSFTAGAGVLVSHSLQTEDWDLLCRVWNACVRRGGKVKISAHDATDILSDRNLSQRVTLVLKRLQVAPKEGEAKVLKSLLKFLATHSLGQLEETTALDILNLFRDPVLYEKSIEVWSGRNRKALCTRLYRQYRELPGVKVSRSVLKAMVKSVFYPHDAAGMEQARRDWYVHYGKLGFWGYQKFIAFYARRGDVTTVYRLWDDYNRDYPDDRVGRSRDQSKYANLLQVHAVRNEVSEVERVFGEIKTKYGAEPNTIDWNIRLKAHVDKRNLASGLKVFEELCQATKPDHYSFGTLMMVAGMRGELDLTLQLYDKAKELGVQPTVAMLDSVVEAYCQNDRLDEAERICTTATKEGRLRGDMTALWNTLLHHYAIRHELTTVSRILEVMSSHRLDYNDETYTFLLLALVQCRQSHHALHLLRTAYEKNIFTPRVEHYVLLMAGFIRTGEPSLALQVHSLMRRLGLPRTNDSSLMLIRALSKTKDWRRTQDRELVRQAMRELHRSLQPRRPTSDPNSSILAPLENRGVSHQGFSVMMFLFSQMRDFTSVAALADLYRATVTAGSDDQQRALPHRLLSSMMLADFYEGRYDRVTETWDYLFQEARRVGSATRTNIQALVGGDVFDRAFATAFSDKKFTADKYKEERIVPAYQYILTEALRTMQRVYQAKEDAQGLMALVQSVTAAGFKLDSKNWNFYVQTLARMKRWKEAFWACETQLMPDWRGWKRSKVFLDHRRTGISPKNSRPISHTIFILVKGYMELGRMAFMSREAEHVITFVHESCGRVTTAIKSMTELRKKRRIRKRVWYIQGTLERILRGSRDEAGLRKRVATYRRKSALRRKKGGLSFHPGTTRLLGKGEAAFHAQPGIDFPRDGPMTDEKLGIAVGEAKAAKAAKEMMITDDEYYEAPPRFIDLNVDITQNDLDAIKEALPPFSESVEDKPKS